MSHHHTHTHGTETQHLQGKKLLWAIVLNLGITLSQVVGAVLSGSLSLLSDAMHNLGDTLSLIISYAANRLSRKSYSQNRSFGFRRAETLAAFVNSASIIGVAIYIFTEAINRLLTEGTEEVVSMQVIILAGIGIVGNGLSVLLLMKDARGNMNIKAAFLHLISDTLFSVAVLAGGLAMYFYQIYWIDSVLSIGIACYLVYSSWGLFIKSIRIMMEFAPLGIDLQQVAKRVEGIEEIKNIHHIHTWLLDEHEVHFQAHLDMESDLRLSQSCKIIQEVKHILQEEFGIGHVTLQVEYGVTDNKNLVVQDS